MCINLLLLLLQKAQFTPVKAPFPNSKVTSHFS